MTNDKVKRKPPNIREPPKKKKTQYAIPFWQYYLFQYSLQDIQGYTDIQVYTGTTETNNFHSYCVTDAKSSARCRMFQEDNHLLLRKKQDDCFSLYNQLDVANKTITNLNEEIIGLKDKIKKSQRLSYSEISENNTLLKNMTVIQTGLMYDWLYKRCQHKVPFLINYCGSISKSGPSNKSSNMKMFGALQQMNGKDLMLLTLMKIRMGCSHEDLASRFGLSKATISRTLSTWIPFLALEFKIFMQPVTREQNKTCYPECFRSFGDNVVSILDCTEGQCERPSIAKAQAQAYSSYKN
ncbi:uncharacterized protein LOC124808652 [Hydra vulgaris]|uniref:uncharacterized protein LOC124808652 n=1 Tax=Hydra vulgaris TaxID=6087 RepID=UPI001F5FBBC5|nr:uncharacterized protein LOC124808652 [Hydra vulgaris]